MVECIWQEIFQEILTSALYYVLKDSYAGEVKYNIA